MGALISLFKFLLPVFAAGLLGYGALVLATGRQTPARRWIMASKGRMAMAGVFALFLVWILVATYLQITSI